jgi:hypothetical protein
MKKILLSMLFLAISGALYAQESNNPVRWTAGVGYDQKVSIQNKTGKTKYVQIYVDADSYGSGSKIVVFNCNGTGRGYGTYVASNETLLCAVYNNLELWWVSVNPKATGTYQLTDNAK